MSAAWEMFDAVGSDHVEPIIRELDNADGRYDWPDNELTGEIACVNITVHGDRPSGAFVKVTGRDRDAVAAAFARTSRLILAGALADVYAPVPS